MSRPYFLPDDAASNIVGFGKPFRGFIRARRSPEVNEAVEGQLFTGSWTREKALSTVQTTLVLRFDVIADDDRNEAYLVETRNSVYVVSV